MPQVRYDELESSWLRWAVRVVIAASVTCGGWLLNRGVDSLDSLTTTVNKTALDVMIVRGEFQTMRDSITLKGLANQNAHTGFADALKDHEIRIRGLEYGTKRVQRNDRETHDPKSPAVE